MIDSESRGTPEKAARGSLHFELGPAEDRESQIPVESTCSKDDSRVRSLSVPGWSLDRPSHPPAWLRMERGEKSAPLGPRGRTSRIFHRVAFPPHRFYGKRYFSPSYIAFAKSFLENIICLYKLSVNHKNKKVGRALNGEG
jgi:hypothetical protein